jgi:hypothetical protein
MKAGGGGWRVELTEHQTWQKWLSYGAVLVVCPEVTSKKYTCTPLLV